MTSQSVRLACPKCSAILDPVVAAAVQVDVCPGCAGVWLDKGELEKLYGTWGIVDIERASAGKRQVPPSTPLVNLDCPVCANDLLTLDFDELAVDGCKNCGGVWLDRGELALALDRIGAIGDPELIVTLAQAVAAKQRLVDRKGQSRGD